MKSDKDRATVVALVGCGAAAEQFYISPLAAQIGPDFRVILVDIDRERAEGIAKAINAEAAGSLSEAAEMGAKGAILATPHHIHHAQALEAMGLGMDLFIEKPVTVNAADAIDIQKRAAALGRLVMVNNNRRLFPSYQGVAEALIAGRIGKLTSVVVNDGSEFAWPTKSGFYLTSKEARGVLLDRGAHTVDILNWWLNGKMRVLKCQHDGIEGADALSRLWLAGPNSEEIALRFSRLYKLDNSYHIVGSKGEIRGRLFAWDKYEERIGGGDWCDILCKSNSPNNYEEFVVRMIGQFVDYMKHDVRPSFTIDDVVQSIEVLDEAYAVATVFDLPWYDEWKAV